MLFVLSGAGGRLVQAQSTALLVITEFELIGKPQNVQFFEDLTQAEIDYMAVIIVGAQGNSVGIGALVVIVKLTQIGKFGFKGPESFADPPAEVGHPLVQSAGKRLPAIVN